MWSVLQSAKRLYVPFIFLLALCAGLFAMDTRGVFGSLRAVAAPVSQPLAYRLSGIRNGVGSTLLVIPESFSAVKRVKALEQQNSALMMKVASLESVASENATLRQELVTGTKTVKERVAGKLLLSPQQAIVLLEQPIQVQVGMPIIRESTIIGLVETQLSPTVVTVILTVNPAFKAKGKIMHNGQAVSGIIHGQYGTEIIIDKVLAQAELAQDNIVTIDDAEKPLANGFIVGKIKQVHKKEAEVFQSATIVPLVDITQENTVFVEK